MSRRLAFVVLILSVALGACIPGFPQVSGGDSQATALVLAGTQAAQTLALLPSPTLPPSNTPLPTFTLTAAPSATDAPTGTATTAPNSTETTSPTATGSPVSATASPTVTATVGTVVGTFTFTPTPGVLLYGTVPPAVPYGRVHLINLSNRMVYISFHCVIENGLTSYLEYPVYSKLTASIPAGMCHYVAFIKGQQFTGDVRIKKQTEYTFTFKRQSIKITQP